MRTTQFSSDQAPRKRAYPLYLGRYPIFSSHKGEPVVVNLRAEKETLILIRELHHIMTATPPLLEGRFVREYIDTDNKTERLERSPQKDYFATKLKSPYIFLVLIIPFT